MPDTPLADRRILDANPRDWAALLAQQVHGHALWFAVPASQNGGSVGDVGFIDGGRFIKLYNIFDPEYERVVGVDPRAYGLTRADVYFVSKQTLYPLSFSSTICSFELSINLETGPLELPPQIKGALSTTVSSTEERIAFIAFCGPGTTGSRCNKSKSMGMYLFAAHRQILAHFGQQYSFDTNHLFIIQETTTAASWLGGLASASQFSVQAEASLGGAGVSARVLSNNDRGWTFTHGNQSWERQYTTESGPCIVIRPVQIMSRGFLQTVKSTLRSATAGSGADSRRGHSDGGPSGQMGGGGTPENDTAGSQPAPSDPGPSHQHAGYGAGEEVLTDKESGESDGPLLDDQTGLLGDLLNFVLESWPTAEYAIGSWDVITAFIKLHGEFPENWKTTNFITAVVEPCDDHQSTAVRLVEVQLRSMHPVVCITATVAPVTQGPQRLTEPGARLEPSVLTSGVSESENTTAQRSAELSTPRETVRDRRPIDVLDPSPRVDSVLQGGMMHDRGLRPEFTQGGDGDSMSLIDLGSRCSSCGTVDFQPIRCPICTGEYCGTHIHGHACSPPAPPPPPAQAQEPAGEQSQRLERCAFQPCDRPVLDAMSAQTHVLCAACARAFCAYHCEPASHQCVPLPREPEEPRSAEASAILRRHFPDLPHQPAHAPPRPQRPITDSAKLRRLDALEVMKLRHRAKPADPRETNVPQHSRVHARVNRQGRPPGESKLLWFKKSISTGRAVDLCATLFNIARTGDLALYEIQPTTPPALVRLPDEHALEDNVSDGIDLILAAPADITPVAE